MKTKTIVIKINARYDIWSIGGRADIGVWMGPLAGPAGAFGHILKLNPDKKYAIRMSPKESKKAMRCVATVAIDGGPDISVMIGRKKINFCGSGFRRVTGIKKFPATFYIGVREKK